MIDFSKTPRYLMDLRPPHHGVSQTVVEHPVSRDLYMSQGIKDTALLTETTVINRFTKAGVFQDRMTLRNGGHGTVFSIEVKDTATFIWIAWSKDDERLLHNDLVRVPYVANHILSYNDLRVAKYDKFGSGYCNIMFDWLHDLVAFRQRSGKFNTYTLLWASDFKKGIFNPLAAWRVDNSLLTMQGFCTADRHLYLLTGAANGRDLPLITRVDWFTHGVETLDISKCAKPDGTTDDNFTEPEGVSLARDAAGEPSLRFTVVTGKNPNRHWNLWEL